MIDAQIEKIFIVLSEKINELEACVKYWQNETDRALLRARLFEEQLNVAEARTAHDRVETTEKSS